MGTLSRVLLAVFVIHLGAGCPSSLTPKLTLSRVVLYRNGMAYLEHRGRLEGDRLHLELAKGEIDDVLKTLTVVAGDGGGPLTVAAEVEGGPSAAKKAKRSLTLRFSKGRGRALSLTYATGAPVWKPTYRLVLGDPTAAKQADRRGLLQTWALVTNASAQDWRDVELTLGTDRPVSYRVALLRPERVARPWLATKPAAVRALSGLVTGGVDRDHDGIPDVDDRCPDHPENYNGFIDTDGCPDRGKVVVSSSRISVLDKIYFAAGSSTVQARSLPILAAIAKTLKANSSIRQLRLGGHAAAGERDRWTLSRARARAVRRALRKLGVGIELAVVGYGATRLIDKRRSSAAEARNRRVEFTIVRRRRPVGGVTGARLARTTPNRSRALPLAGATRYRLAQRTTIRRGRSALVSVFSRRLRAEEVLLYRADAPQAASHPTRAAWLRGDRVVGLPAGPVAIFARGAYVGDGALTPLAPGQQALLPFAIERGSRVEVDRDERRLVGEVVALRRTQLLVADRLQRSARYRVEAGPQAPPAIVIAHRLRAGYTALSLPPQSRRWRQTLFLRLPLAAGKALSHVQREERRSRRSFELTAPQDVELLAGYLRRSQKLDAKTRATLNKVLALQRRWRDLRRERRRSGLGDPRLRRRAKELRRNLATLAKLRESRALRRKLLAELSALERRLAAGVRARLAFDARRLTITKALRAALR
jgi:outer membrane protein OmpA-like peptidoglycan-associated protein